MANKTVILTNNKTGREYPVSEAEANTTLSNPLLKMAFSKKKTPEPPAEVKAMRKQAKPPADPAGETDSKSTSDPNTTKERSSAGNDNK